jgi:ABC-type glycerol-3-phosphate transport system substrate-binding protein
MVVAMQPYYSPCRQFFGRRCGLLFVASIASLFGVAAGCIERPTTIDAPPDRPYAGKVLTVAAADPADRELLKHLTRSWAVRSGAEIRILDEPWDGTADIGLIPPADLARWAEPGLLAETPSDIRQPTHPYRWDEIVPSYSLRLSTWRDRNYALPIIAEGLVLAYRKDAFDGKDGRPADPPATWSDLLTVASRLGKKSLPPLPADAERLGAEFFVAAACYDRPAVGRIGGGELIREDFFAFQFHPTAGEPRLDAPVFAHIAQLFRDMQAFRGDAKDAAAAFRSGDAKVGILSLAELGRVGPELAEQLGVAALPGAEFTFDLDGSKRPNELKTVNRVPYVGWGGRMGVVSAKCSALAAAWDFLVDAGLPDRAALDLIAAARWGAGPYRVSQLETRARPRWFGYGLTATETDRLIAGLRDNLGPGVQNYRVRLRTPNQHELATVWDEELRKILNGSAPVDMKTANARWQAIIDKQPPGEWKILARKSLGL